MTFSIIIVSWNVREKLQENLRSLKASFDVDYEIIVIDNASGDGTAEMVKKEFPDVILVANSDNKGFAKACNQGLAISRGEYCVLLNPDMRIFPETLYELSHWLDTNPQADVAGIKLVDEDGKNLNHVRRFPKLADQLAIVLKLPHVFPKVLHSYLCPDFNYEAAARVDSIRGAFFVIRRSALEKYGMLDERYFLWFEEVDYCRSIAAEGGEVWYTPAAKAIDYVGQSFNQVGRTNRQRYFRDSMIAYFKKWHPGWQAAILQVAWVISGLIVAVAGMFKIKPRVKT